MRGTACPLLPLPQTAELHNDDPNFVEVDSQFGLLIGPLPLLASRLGSFNLFEPLQGVAVGVGLGEGVGVGVGVGVGAG